MASSGGRGAAEPVGLPIPTETSGVVSTFDSDQSLGASYPRVVELQHYAAGKGQLIATFVRRGGFPIYRSTDRGETWQFVTEVKALMVKASQIVLSGFALKVGIEVTKYPDHLTDKRGTRMWEAVMKQMDLLKRRRRKA